MKHTVVALVQDHPGVLHRVVSLFRRVATISKSHGRPLGNPRREPHDDRRQRRRRASHKQLNRLVEVLKVQDVTQDRTVERETVLIKVHAGRQPRRLIGLTARTAPKVVDVGATSLCSS